MLLIVFVSVCVTAAALSTPHQDSYIRFGAPNDDHTMIIHTNGPTLLDAGANLDVTVEGEKHETVRGNTKEWYMSAKDETVTGKHTIKVHGGRNEMYSEQTTLVQGVRREEIKVVSTTRFQPEGRSGSSAET